MELLKVLYSAVRKNSLIRLLKSDSISLRMDSGIFPLRIMPSYANTELDTESASFVFIKKLSAFLWGNECLSFFSRLLLEVYDTWHFLVQIKGEK